MSRLSGSPCITEIALERRHDRYDLHPRPDPEHRPGRRRHDPHRTGGLGPPAAGGRRADPPGEGRRGPLGRAGEAGPEDLLHGASGLRRRPSNGSGPNWRPSGPPRATPGRQEAASRRREQVQAEYVEDFHGAVLAFLAFHPSHADLADRLARAVTEHATPVGSGTVARTKRIPVEQRAEAAVIAWMRHQTTGYDDMAIPRVKGKRREVRRMLARRSQELLDRYRRGEPIPEGCPLRRALAPESIAG